LHVMLRRRKYRLLAQSFGFLELLARRFREIDGWLPLGAFHGGRLVAATIYLKWGHTLYYKFNASDQDSLLLRPNDLLLWAGLELGRSLGCDTLDLGLTPLDQAGLIRFKRGFGASQQPLWSVRWTPPGWQCTEGVARRRRLEAAASRWIAPVMSDETAARAGRRLYRFFA
jgi:CelD/BcsL family acetyltransferase involved in cellulose biosynthesis